MKTGSRFLLLTVTLLMVFVFSAMLTVPAYADDSTPPPTETPTEVTPPVDESTLEPVPVAEESMPVVEETTAENLAQIPEGTDVVVVNADGEVLPLATKEAEQALVDGDPMWCPAGVAPSTANPLCSGAFTGISNIGSGTGIGNTGDGSLAHWLDINDPAKAGVIWIEHDYDGWIGEIDFAIALNGLDFANLDNFALTLQGGWNGVNGSPALNVAQPYSTLALPLTITNWTGAITIKNLNFSIVNFGGPSDQALEVGTKGAITLDTVNVVNNVTSGAGVYDGALLNNTSGTGSVTINKSKFNNNEGFGLMINSNGAITLANVLVNGNDAGGATLNNTFAAAAKAVTITTGTNEFSNNGGTGLAILSKGAVTFKDITVTGNSGNGATVDNHLTATAQPVTLTGTNVFSGNTNSGLVVSSRGTISASNLIANDNINGWGAELDNTFAVTALPVKLTGTNEFKFNGGGLWILSNGTISTNNLVATNSFGDDGVTLWNDYGFVSNVTMTGTNIFTDNYMDGLEIYSLGSITLNNIKANGNDYGAYIDNSSASTPMSVVLNGINTFNNNYASGLEIYSKGAVTLSKVTASDNSSGYGALIHNEEAALPKAVTLNGYGTFNHNGLDGLNITSKGAIILNNLTANDNIAGYGVWIDNCGFVASPLWTCTGSPGAPQNVTINGTNTFNGNKLSGLAVRTYGAILTNNLTANNNAQTAGPSGVDLSNNSGLIPKPVTLNGINAFAGNAIGWDAGNGLQIYSLGTITVNKLDASNDNGAYLYNRNAPIPAGVNITGWVYVDWGFDVRSDGDVKIANLNINAEGNIFFGGFINTLGSVTLSGASQIFNSTNLGLDITARGPVTLSNLTVSGNRLEGITIDNAYSPMTPQNVTITGSNTFWDNGQNGLIVTTYGAITISNIDAYQNGQGAIYLDNCGAYDNGNACDPSLLLAPKAITITGANFFEASGGDGLFAVSFGAISVSNLHSTDNTGNGAYLNNQWGAGSKGGITLTGVNDFENNGAAGLVAFSNGTISMSNLTANLNKGNGVNLNNHANTAVAVTLSGVNTFTNNGTTGAGSGLVINAGGQITLSNITATGNQANGATLDNFTYTSSLVIKPSIKLTGVNTFNQNLANGLLINSRGAVDLVNITADDNGVDGIHVNTLGAFTLTCGSMNNNTGNGWDLTAGGLITLKGVFGFGNTSGNITSSTPVTVRACPVPAPLVIAPVDDSDKEPHGSKRPALVYIYERR